jgi:hypothetical protein
MDSKLYLEGLEELFSYVSKEHNELLFKLEAERIKKLSKPPRPSRPPPQVMEKIRFILKTQDIEKAIIFLKKEGYTVFKSKLAQGHKQVRKSRAKQR